MIDKFQEEAVLVVVVQEVIARLLQHQHRPLRQTQQLMLVDQVGH
jgi:hypothetical protein